MKSSPGDAMPPQGQVEEWMGLALEEAERAAAEREVPVGAVAVLGERLIARDHNRTIQRGDPTAHAEILVMRQAARDVENYRLLELDLFVTLEPCAMCAGAMIWARIGHLYFGARDAKAGAVVSRVNLLTPGLFNHTVAVTEGVLGESCAGILSDFFKARR